MSRAERLLPWACLLAAALLFASEFMTMFEFTPPGGEALASQDAAERHGNALFVIAGFAAFATIVAVWSGSQPAAMAVGALGAVALLIFLLNDLPDAGQVGTLDDARQSFIDAEATPQSGFWLMMIGSLALAISGVALATLGSDQLRALRPGAGREARSEREPRRAARPPAAGEEPRPRTGDRISSPGRRGDSMTGPRPRR